MALVAILGMSACAAGSGGFPRPVPEDARAPASTARPSTPLVGEGLAAERDEPRPVLSFPGGLTLDALSTAVVARHPELRAAEAELSALEAEVDAASLRPNPSLNVQVEDLGAENQFDGPNGGQTTVMVAHTLERGGKRAARQELAQARLEQARAEWALRAQALQGRAAMLFYACMSAEEQTALLREREATLAAIVDAVQGRVEAGRASSVDLDRLAVTLTQTRLTTAGAMAEAQAALTRIERLLGGSVRVESLGGGWPAPVEPPDLEALLAGWRTSPRRRALETSLSTGKAAVRAARSERRPDWELSAGVRRREPTNDWTAVVGFDVPLPLFNSGRAAVRAAEARQKERRFQMESELQVAESSLADLRQRIDTSLQTLRTLDAGATARARKVLESVREGYAAGTFDLREVLDAQEAYFVISDTERRARAEHQTAWAELETLMGASWRVER